MTEEKDRNMGNMGLEDDDLDGHTHDDPAGGCCECGGDHCCCVCPTFIDINEDNGEEEEL